MNIWLLTYIGLQILGLGIHTAKHGEKLEGNYSFWMKLTSLFIGVVLMYMAIKTGF